MLIVTLIAPVLMLAAVVDVGIRVLMIGFLIVRVVTFTIIVIV